MKLTFIILTTLFALTFASPVSIIKASTITDNLSQLLYTHLNPILENTLQQLTKLVFELEEKFSQYIEHSSSRSNPVKPAEWVSQLFNGTNSISTQWNNHITDFFANIPTVFETNDRSLLNFLLMKNQLHKAVEKLLEKLKKLFNTNINQLVISFINEFNLKKSIGQKHYQVDLNDFQREVSGVFDKTKEQLNRTIDDLIDSIFSYLNTLKNRFFD